MKSLGRLTKWLLVAGMLTVPGCVRENTVVEYVYETYPHVLGNAEYERDGEFGTDDYTDEDIEVILTFEDNMYGFEPGDIVGYYKTIDYNPINFWFKFVPPGDYGLEASLWDGDDYIWALSDIFYHSKNEDTYVDIYLWLNSVGKQSPGGEFNIQKRDPKRLRKDDLPSSWNPLYLSKKMYDLVESNVEPELLEDFRESVKIMEADKTKSLRKYLPSERKYQAQTPAVNLNRKR